MRTIKFRAWDKEKKLFIYSEEFEFISMFWMSAELVGACFDFIQQFTGLKDKNGVEIYEGDIAEFYYLGWHKSEIKFIEYGYFVETTGHTDDVREKLKITFPFKNFEVIGNIYQNPELL